MFGICIAFRSENGRLGRKPLGQPPGEVLGALGEISNSRPLGIEIRCSIQLSYERTLRADPSDLGGQGQQPWPASAARCRQDPGGLLLKSSGSKDAGGGLTDIGGRALVALVGRRAVVIGEAAGGRAGAVVVQIADVVGRAQ